MGEVPAVLSDPIGVMVGLITEVDAELDHEVVEAMVVSVAGGRAKRRKLAQSLAERPEILTDGRSPAPRALGDLLIELVKAGATAISPPICAKCGKPLRTLQRRGEDWYCGVCGPIRLPCANCGDVDRVHSRDRHGQPRCSRCGPGTGLDGGPGPIEIVTEVLASIDPDLPAEAIAAAVNAAAPQAGKRHQMAWAVQDRPDLLIGAGAEAPTPAVLRLIGKLCEAGAVGVVRPPCPHCGRVIKLHRPIGGQWRCRTCVAKSRAQPCSGCGRVCEAAARNDQGEPICPNCLVSDPANLEVCVNCGRLRVVNTRSPDGPLCPTCPPLPTTTCSICEQRRPCGSSRLTGLAWCPSCQHRDERCSRCGQVKPVGSGPLTEPLCRDCTVPAFPDCPVCEDSPRPGQCVECRLELRLRKLMTGPDGVTHPALLPLRDALAATDPPGTALRWLAKEPVATVLADVAAGRRQLTHADLDELPQRTILNHLRSVLVATGTLPPRDEQMARLERFLIDALAARPDPDQRQLLHRYAVWHLLRRLRRRNNGSLTTNEQYTVVLQRVRSATALLDWLTAHDLTLASCGQADLDQWLTDDDASHHHHAGHFVRWAARQRLTTLSFPATRWQGPTRVIDDQARWDAARRLLHDDTIGSRDRLAGLLVLLYAQPVARISRLTTDHVTIDDTTATIQLGTTPITLPEPVANLTRHVLDGKRGHATTGAAAPSPWLFPGGQPGRPIRATHLGTRLKDLGIQPGQARSTALFQLATELPAALLARMLGIHIDVAVAWQRASSGDWMNYAADVSRRIPENR
ncbi:hypothetical protein GCM10023195_55120 [Actinoallomurus liliacearum]|uniref:Site-specific integrase n=1 Tax=Actinoallomurus liliacearum TaxID=1080073 RepID=A0ABP8TSX1_9ACTN